MYTVRFRYYYAAFYTRYHQDLSLALQLCRLAGCLAQALHCH
jgi:hypothetical protein